MGNICIDLLYYQPRPLKSREDYEFPRIFLMECMMQSEIHGSLLAY